MKKRLYILQWVIVGVASAVLIFLLGYWLGIAGPKPALIFHAPPGSATVFSSDYFASMQAKYDSYLANGTLPISNDTTARALTGSSVVASKSGTKYYPKDCPAAKRLKQDTLRIFASASEAELAGYTRSSRCP